MAEQPKFNQEKLPELKELMARVERLEREIKKEEVPEKKVEIVKEEIRGYLRELQETPTFVAPTETRDEAKEIVKMEPSQRVGALVSLVFEKGLVPAISVARNLNDPAILDEFHDTLVDHFYNLLLKKGLIKLF